MDNTVWIIVAIVVALIVLGAVVFLAGKARHRRRTEEADRIRQSVAEDSRRVDRQSALAQEAEARSRAAQAEADAKAAEAARLADTAASRRETLDSAKEHINSRLSEADDLDPRVGRDKNDDSTAADHQAATDHRATTDRKPEAERMRPDTTRR